ncbi:integrase domain-containing protein [Caballeronia calidae]|uniref:Integrase domain-containing protein n=1 Tax=Caballeronia calidae TaxID=1777139 RepID=A0A158EJ51_9BURK|nr:tyrosine-type recombinase/integrase [Caballeronia calidae]SAL06879.1 integrase domain-containing protein [Caballeronia calidae]
MKPNRPNALGKALVRYFQEYLPNLRGMSPHTIHGYRDAIVLFLRFISEHTGRSIENLDMADLNAEHVVAFLDFLERERHNSISTRNARLAALHCLAHFVASEHPECLSQLQRVLGVPFKRGTTRHAIEYLEANEVKALLSQIDRSTQAGQRDYALFALMFNTGARVQEVLNLRRCDIRTEPPYQVRLLGKGGKVRTCPIWVNTASLLRDLSQALPDTEDNQAALFRNERGGKLTRFGVGYLLRKYVTEAATTVDTLRSKRIHPHSVRHSTAVALLKAGVDFATISQWLGHASLNTTMVYARADLDLKRQALTQVFPDVLGASAPGRLTHGAADLLGWLRRL